MQEDTLEYLGFASPLGWILLGAMGGGLCLLHIFDGTAPGESEIQEVLRREYPSLPLESGERNTLLAQTRDAVLRYLSEGTPLPSIPIRFGKSTPFQREVWTALCQIPPGETRSYGEIARRIGRPRSARAVGQACGKNPVAIIVPCHRVTGSGGKLGGYSGGLHIKKALLELEKEMTEME